MDRQPANQMLLQMIGGYWISQAISVAAELGVADHLNGEARSVDDLAAETGAQPEPLYRLLRALASVGIFEETVPRVFSSTPMAVLLRSDVPDSKRAFARIMGAEHYAAWGKLADTVRTGNPGWELAHTLAPFEYFAKNPERGRLFDESMTGVHGAESEPMLDAYDFSEFHTVVDVGGGNGLLMAALLERHVGLRGVVFDMPQVAEHARATLDKVGLNGRVQVSGGDFFESVPQGGQAYILRHVLHDWDDDQAAAILRNCRDAMEPAGKILVIENVIPAGNDPSFGKWLDLMMLVIGGRERTAEQYADLFAKAGLRLTRIVPTAHEISIVEAVAS